MRVNKRLVVSLGTLVLFACGTNVNAQIGLIDDLAKISKAAKVSKLSRAGRLAASVTDGAGRMLGRVPASEATRKAFRITLAVAAGDSFAALPAAAGRLRVYLGLESAGLKFIADKNPGIWDLSRMPETRTLDDYVNALRASGQQVDGIDYIVEADVVNHPSFRFNTTDTISVANYAGTPWPLRRVGAQKYAAEVTPSLWVNVSERAIEDLKHVLDLAFDRRDMRVATLLDPDADVESLDALRKATAGTSYENIESAAKAVSFVASRRGRIVTLVGHVEDQQFVAHGLLKEKFRVSIPALLEAADANDVSLILLGCDTAGMLSVAGVSGRVNSVAVASQLKAALNTTSYGEFLSALGTPDLPFVVSEDVMGQARLVVAARMRREAAADRAGVLSASVSPKLAQSQVQNEQQLVRSVPGWLDETLRFAIGVITLSFVGALISSVFKRSLSPLKTTSLVIGLILALPFRLLVGRRRGSNTAHAPGE